MRSPANLINYFREWSRPFTGAVLIVGFESSTVFVFRDDGAQLEKLNDAVHLGGEPIGMIGYDRCDGVVKLHHPQALEEYAEEEWVSRYLDGLMLQIMKAVLDRPGMRAALWDSAAEGAPLRKEKKTDEPPCD